MQGYYSLVQYCPDLARREAANVGVVLCCPALKFLRARLIRGNGRIRRFFGAKADGELHLNAMKHALQERLQRESATLMDVDSFRTFVETRANKIILTAPTPVNVSKPENDLKALYRELVTS